MQLAICPEGLGVKVSFHTHAGRFSIRLSVVGDDLGLVSDATSVCFNSIMYSCLPIDDGLLKGIGRSGLYPNMTEDKQPFSYRRLIPPTAAITSFSKTASLRTVDRSGTTMNLELVFGKLTAPICSLDRQFHHAAQIQRRPVDSEDGSRGRRTGAPVPRLAASC